MNNTDISLLDANKIELHYWFNDDSHTMDAIIQNKCEFEFLAILKEITNTLNVDVIIETEPLAEGGLRRYFNVVLKSEKKNAVITTAVITTILTAVITTPISSSITKITELFIEKLFEDKERKELEKEKLKLEIEKLKQEIQPNVKQLESNNIIKKRRSNFYEVLENYPKINKISVAVNDENNNTILYEHKVLKRDFKDFILVTDDLEPLQIDDVVIEIISPVLKKGKYKWIGIYNGQSISFNMKSNEFKTLVQTGRIEFKNGSSINCELQIKRKMSGEGIEKNTEYNVARVNHYFENDKPIETPEGRKRRKEKEAEKQQLKFDFGDDYN